MQPALIRFPEGRQAHLLCVPPDASSEQIVAALALPPPRAVIVLNGGTQAFSSQQSRSLGLLLRDGLARFAAEEHVTLVTGAGNVGIFALLGQGLARWDRSAPCIGVAISRLVTWSAPTDDRIRLEPHHSHFVLVEGREWGDETAAMYGLIAALARSCPSLAIFAGGGEIARQEMLANINQRRTMVLLVGSGRATDAVLDTPPRTVLPDRRTRQVAAAGLSIPFNIRSQPAALYQLLHKILFPPLEQ